MNLKIAKHPKELPTEQLPPTQTPPTQDPPTPPSSNNNDDPLLADLSQSAKGAEEFSFDYAPPQDEMNDAPEMAFQEEVNQTTDPEISLINTKMWMDIREQLQSLGISLYADGSIDGFDKYHFHPAHKDNLVRAWSRVISHYNVPAPPPFIDILIAELAANMPLVQLARQNRKYRLENEELRAENNMIKSSGDPYGRPDQKTLWLVDNQGFFEYTKKGKKFVRLTKAEKKTIPSPTGEALIRLIKHNGEEKIKSIFKL